MNQMKKTWCFQSKKSQKSKTENNRLMGTGLLDMYSTVYLSDRFTIPRHSNPNSVSL